MNRRNRVLLTATALTALLSAPYAPRAIGQSVSTTTQPSIEKSSQEVSSANLERKLDEDTLAVQEDLQSYDSWVTEVIAPSKENNTDSRIYLLSPSFLDESLEEGFIAGLIDYKPDGSIWLPQRGNQKHLSLRWAHSLSSQAGLKYLLNNNEIYFGSDDVKQAKIISDEQLDSFVNRKSADLNEQRYNDILDEVLSDHTFQVGEVVNNDLEFILNETAPLYKKMEEISSKYISKMPEHTRLWVEVISDKSDKDLEIATIKDHRLDLFGLLIQYKGSVVKKRIALGKVLADQVRINEEDIARSWFVFREYHDILYKGVSERVSGNDASQSFIDVDLKMRDIRKNIEKRKEDMKIRDTSNNASITRDQTILGVIVRTIGSLYDIHLGKPDYLSFQLNEQDLDFLSQFKIKGKTVFEKGISRYRVALEMVGDGVEPAKVRERLLHAGSFSYNGKEYLWPKNNFSFRESLTVMGGKK